MKLVLKKLYLNMSSIWTMILILNYEMLVRDSRFVWSSCFFLSLFLLMGFKLILDVRTSNFIRRCCMCECSSLCDNILKKIFFKELFYLRSLPALLTLLLGPDTPPPSPQLITLILTTVSAPAHETIQLGIIHWSKHMTVLAPNSAQDWSDARERQVLALASYGA